MGTPRSKNITWHSANITHEEREKHLDQKGCVVWFTGLSASGKSTIARKVEELLVRRGHACYALDGDNLRMGLNRDLGFSARDRAENIRRVASVAQLFADAGVITLTAFISPYRSDRDDARAELVEGRFVECHVATTLEECERRDPKGLYKKARAGEIPSFTGISDPYEPPEHPELVLDTAGKTIEESASEVVDYLGSRGFLTA